MKNTCKARGRERSFVAIGTGIPETLKGKGVMEHDLLQIPRGTFSEKMSISVHSAQIVPQ